MSEFLSCKNCNWVHKPISRKQAEEQVESFRKYFNSLDPKGKDLFGSAIDISYLEHCFGCGGSYKDVNSQKIASGVYTIQQIIKWDE